MPYVALKELKFYSTRTPNTIQFTDMNYMSLCLICCDYSVISSSMSSQYSTPHISIILISARGWSFFCLLTVSSQLSTLTRLKFLSLINNSLTGSVPPGVSFQYVVYTVQRSAMSLSSLQVYEMTCITCICKHRHAWFALYIVFLLCDQGGCQCVHKPSFFICKYHCCEPA